MSPQFNLCHRVSLCAWDILSGGMVLHCWTELTVKLSHRDIHIFTILAC